MNTKVLFLKARNPGYTRKDGTYVAPFDDKRQDAKLVGKSGKQGKKPDSNKPRLLPSKARQAGTAYHPKLNEQGKPEPIREPSRSSTNESWHDPDSTAVFLPGGAAPKTLNGVALKPWTEAPITDEGWDFVDGHRDIDEPEFVPSSGKESAAGSVIVEPDGRVWAVDPTNGFGGYRSTFPKGNVCPGTSMQANAIRECWEESGIKVAITGFIGDFERTTTKTRYYLARRVAGTPSDCGWESQSVRLVPKGQLMSALNRAIDQEIADRIPGMPAGRDIESPESIPLWKQLGPRQGSNPGGTFRDGHGAEWYVKFPRTADIAANEVLAANLYRAAGIDVPDVKFITRDGKLGIASRMIPGVVINEGKVRSTTPGVADGFVVDAWLANWDSVGLVFDNMLIAPDGRAVRIDAGGSLLYRAQGAPKGDAFGNSVGETKTLLSGANEQAMQAFRGVTQEQQELSARRVLSIDDDVISRLCQRFGPGQEKDRAALADKLIARKADIARQYPTAMYGVEK